MYDLNYWISRMSTHVSDIRSPSVSAPNIELPAWFTKVDRSRKIHFTFASTLVACHLPHLTVALSHSEFVHDVSLPYA